MILLINAYAEVDPMTCEQVAKFAGRLGEDVHTLNLYEKPLPVLDEMTLARRAEALAENDDTNEIIAMAREFSEAESIVIAVPYRNIFYPAVLLQYIEAIGVAGITYSYDERHKPKGRCLATNLYYVTVSGGVRSVKPDFCYDHIRSLATNVFGIKNVLYYRAEDLEGVDLVEGGSAARLLAEEEYLDKPKGNDKDSILIVDDSKVNILKADHILKERGFDTFFATSGMECLNILKERWADVILLDIEMPGMDGFEVLEHLKKNPRTAHIPVIFVTSDKTADVVIKASQKGIAGYIVKPFSEEEIIGRIDSVLEKKKEKKKDKE